MNVAYIVIAHKNPEQVERLIRRMSSIDTYFYIHIDLNSDNHVFTYLRDRLSSWNNVVFLSRRNTYIFSVAITEVCVDAIKIGLKNDFHFDYIAYISGQDYPLVNKETLDNIIGQDPDKSYIHHMIMKSMNFEMDGLHRIQNWWFRYWGNHWITFPVAKGSRIQAVRLLTQAIEKIIKIKRPFVKGMVPYGGSAFWFLSREAAVYVDSFISTHPEYVRFFRYAWNPDEIFIQTIIMNSHLNHKVINNDLHFIRWPGVPSAHPVVLTSKDIEPMLQSGKPFARKFDITVDSDVLDILDRRAEPAACS